MQQARCLQNLFGLVLCWSRLAKVCLKVCLHRFCFVQHLLSINHGSVLANWFRRSFHGQTTRDFSHLDSLFRSCFAEYTCSQVIPANHGWRKSILYKLWKCDWSCCIHPCNKVSSLLLDREQIIRQLYTRGRLLLWGIPLTNDTDATLDIDLPIFDSLPEFQILYHHDRWNYAQSSTVLPGSWFVHWLILCTASILEKN